MNVTEGFELPSGTPDATDAKTAAQVWRLRLFCGGRCRLVIFSAKGTWWEQLSPQRAKGL